MVLCLCIHWSCLFVFLCLQASLVGRISCVFILICYVKPEGICLSTRLFRSLIQSNGSMDTNQTYQSCSMDTNQTYQSFAQKKKKNLSVLLTLYLFFRLFVYFLWLFALFCYLPHLVFACFLLACNKWSTHRAFMRQAKRRDLNRRGISPQRGPPFLSSLFH